MKSPPRPLHGLITAQDYPPAALRRSAEGRTLARLTIGTSGRVGHCSVAQSSGHADLDRRVCDLAITRMRFSPAIDAAGEPIAVDAILQVQWIVD